MAVLVFFASATLIMQLSWLFLRSPYWAFVLSMTVAVINAITIVPVHIEAAGVTLFLEDLVLVSMLLIVFLRALKTLRASLEWMIVVSIFVLTIFAFARGMFMYGFEAAGSDVRRYVYYWGAVLYFLSFKDIRRPVQDYLKAVLVASLALVLLAIFRLVVGTMGLEMANQWQAMARSPGGANIRVLNAEQTFMLGVAFFISLRHFMLGKGAGWQRTVFYILGPIIVLMQHRTIWILVGVGVLWLLFGDPRFRRRVWLGVIGAAVVFAAVSWLLFGPHTREIEASLRGSVTNVESFAWRLEGWRQLLLDSPAAPSTSLERIFGKPFGAGYARYINGVRVDVNPHNYYIQTVLRLGILGLVLLLVVLFKPLLRMLVRTLTQRLNISGIEDFWLLYVLLQAIYFITYPPTFDQGLLMGFALCGLSKTGKLRNKPRTLVSRGAEKCTSQLS